MRVCSTDAVHLRIRGASDVLFFILRVIYSNTEGDTLLYIVFKGRSIECRKTRTKVITSAYQIKDKYQKEPMKTEIHVTFLKRGEKTRVTKSRFLLVLRR